MRGGRTITDKEIQAKEKEIIENIRKDNHVIKIEKKYVSLDGFENEIILTDNYDLASVFGCKKIAEEFNRVNLEGKGYLVSRYDIENNKKEN